jgi:hypothetical protein
MTPRRVLTAWLAVALCLAGAYPHVRGPRLFAVYAALRAICAAGWLFVVVRVALDRRPLSRPALAALALGGGVAAQVFSTWLVPADVVARWGLSHVVSVVTYVAMIAALVWPRKMGEEA